jgi:hypothetical protein
MHNLEAVQRENRNGRAEHGEHDHQRGTEARGRGQRAGACAASERRNAALGPGPPK